MIVGARLDVETRRYMMQPGDGTRYEFSITELNQSKPGIAIDGEGDAIPVDLHTIVRGVDRDYVTITIYSSGRCGSYEFRRDQLENPSTAFIGYATGHMLGIDRYSVAAVILACSVLIKEKDNYQKAAEKMLRAGEYM